MFTLLMILIIVIEMNSNELTKGGRFEFNFMSISRVFNS